MFQLKYPFLILFFLLQIVIKIGILAHNNQFSEAENNLATAFIQRFNSLAKIFVSFHQIHFSYDKAHLISILEKLRDNLKVLLVHHLTEKSINRVDIIFDYFTQAQFLDDLFKCQTGELFRLRGLVANDINKLIEEGHI